MIRYVISLCVTLLAAPVLACGPDSNCLIGPDRHYRIAMPEGHDGTTPVGAIVWSHGYRGTARGAMGNGSLRGLATRMNMALIAMKSGPLGGWDIPNRPRNTDSTGAAEFAYFEAALDDAANRFPIDRNRLIATGFSAGGMMVWNLACARPSLFAGFVPMSGTYWKSPPASCAKPVASIVHIHGDADKTVPLTGRVIADSKQGEVSVALETYANHGDFGPSETSAMGKLTCRNRSNPQGDILEFCLFPGGHSFRTEYLRYGIERLRAAGKI